MRVRSKAATCSYRESSAVILEGTWGQCEFGEMHMNMCKLYYLRGRNGSIVFVFTEEHPWVHPFGSHDLGGTSGAWERRFCRRWRTSGALDHLPTIHVASHTQSTWLARDPRVHYLVEKFPLTKRTQTDSLSRFDYEKEKWYEKQKKKKNQILRR